MPKHWLRPLLVVEFLIAIDAIFTAWSEIGGQYHLDLMFWPWKLGIGVGSAWLITMITANLVNHEGRITKKILMYSSLLLLVLVTAGVVTWYYHLHEPADQDEDDDNDDDGVTPAMVIQSQAAPWLLPVAAEVRTRVGSAEGGGQFVVDELNPSCPAEFE